MKLHALLYHVNVIKTTASFIREGEVHMLAVKGRGSDVQQPSAPHCSSVQGFGLQAGSPSTLYHSSPPLGLSRDKDAAAYKNVGWSGL